LATIVILGDVSADDDRLDTQRLAGRLGLFGACFVVVVVDDDVRAPLCQLSRAGSANAR